MKISIIIPVYNAEKYLEECIRSAIEQSYRNIEVIAVDDGSTDNSLEILEKYSRKIRIIKKKNGGTATALNTGIEAMDGQWFKWLSADDILDNSAVQVLINETKKLGKDAKSCIFYSNYELIDESSDVVGEFVEQNCNDLESLARNVILLDHYYGNATTSLIHKSIFDQCGLFDEKIGYQEDYEFWLRCCLVYGYKLHLVPQKLAKYRIHEQQLTKKKLTDALEHAKTIRSNILKILSHEQQTKYLDALKMYNKQKPLKVRIRRHVRDAAFHVLPESASSKILEIYLNKK